MTERLKRITELADEMLREAQAAFDALQQTPNEETLEDARAALRAMRDGLHGAREFTTTAIPVRDALIGALRDQRVRRLSMQQIGDDAGTNDSNATKRAEKAGFKGRRTKRGGATSRNT